MRIRFQQLQYDQQRQLVVHDEHGEIRLRPKLVKALDHLISRAGQPVSKYDLMRAVWQHEDLDDQAVFQLIADLRRELRAPGCIETVPGQGYRWAWPQRRRWLPSKRVAPAAAAAVLTVVAVWFALLSPRQPTFPIVADPMLEFAISAELQLRAGQPQQAVRTLQRARELYPNSLRLQLRLSRAQGMAGEPARALQTAHDTLSAARLGGDPQIESAALLLLAQLAMLSRHDDIARLWSQQAIDSATGEALQCEANIGRTLLAYIDEHREPPDAIAPALLLAACDTETLSAS